MINGFLLLLTFNLEQITSYELKLRPMNYGVISYNKGYHYKLNKN